MKAALVALVLVVAGCTFEAEPAKPCFYEATIGCGPGCTPRIVHQMIECPSPPPSPAVDGGSD